MICAVLVVSLFLIGCVQSRSAGEENEEQADDRVKTERPPVNVEVEQPAEDEPVEVPEPEPTPRPKPAPGPEPVDEPKELSVSQEELDELENQIEGMEFEDLGGLTE